MAKNRFLSKKSLKSMFSKSEANLESAGTRIFEETVDVEKKKTVSTNKYFKAFFSKSDNRLNESAENNDRYGGGKPSKFKKKTKNDKAVKLGLHKNDISGAEAQGLGEARVQDISPSASKHDERTSHYATAPRSKVKDLSVSELDLHKHRKFGTFTFGLLKRKKKSKGLSQSTTALHHGPEVKGQEEEEEDEPLDLDTHTFFSTVNPLPLDKQSLAMDFLRDYSDMRTVDTMMRRAPIATMPEFEWEEPIDVQRDVSDHDTDTDSINMEAKSPFSLTPPNIPPSLPLTAVGATEKGVAFSVPPLNSLALVICDIPLIDAQPGPVHLPTEASSAAFPIGQPETAALFSTNDHSFPETVTSLSAKLISVPETPPSISTNYIFVPETLPSISTNYIPVPKTLPSISTKQSSVPETLTSTSTNDSSVPETLPSISTNQSSVPETLPSISTNQSSVPETLPSISTNQSSVPETLTSTFTNDSPVPETLPSISTNDVCVPKTLPSISTNDISVPETLTSTSTNDSSFCNSVSAYPTNTISDCVLDTSSYSASAYVALYDSLFPGSFAFAFSDPCPAKDISETSFVPALNTDPPSASVLLEPDRIMSSIITKTDTPINSFVTKTGEPIQLAVTETEPHTVTMCRYFDTEVGDITHSTLLPSVTASSVHNVEVPDCAASNIEGSFTVNELPAEPTGTNTEIAVSDSGPRSIYGSLSASLFPDGFSSTSDHSSSVNSTQTFDPSNFPTNASPSKMAASHTETGVPVHETDPPLTNSEIPISGPGPNTSNPDLDERLHTASSGLDQSAQLSNLAPSVLREDVLTFSPTTVSSENVPHENNNPAGPQPDMTSTTGSIPPVLPECGGPSELAVPQFLPEALPLTSPGAVGTDHPSFPKAEEGVSTPPRERSTVSDTDDRPGTSMNLDVPCTEAETMAASSGPDTVETMAVRSVEDVVEITVSRSAQDVVDIMVAGSGEAVVEIVVAGSDPNVQLTTTENGEDEFETSPTHRQEARVTTESCLRESKTFEENSEKSEEGRMEEESTARQMQESLTLDVEDTKKGRRSVFSEVSDTERLMGTGERGTTEEWSQIEKADQKGGEEVLLVPLVRHVVALEECEWAPPFLEKDEGRKGNLNTLTPTLTHTLPRAEACASTCTHPPGLSPVEEEGERSAGAEYVRQIISGSTQREDHPLPSHTHVTDNEILHTVNPEREDSGAHMAEGAVTSAKITKSGTHTTHYVADKVDFSVPDPDSGNTHTLHAVREGALSHTLTHKSEAVSETITHIEHIVPESDTHFAEREVISGVSSAGGGTLPGRSGRASPDTGVTDQVAAKLSVTETHTHTFPDTVVEREEREDSLPETHLSQPARSVNASADPSPAVEQPGLHTQLIRADLDSDPEMNSSDDIQSTLSTTFTLRPSSTSEGSPPNKAKHRIHKVSLVSEDASARAAPESVDLSGIRTDPEPGGPEVEYKRKQFDVEIRSTPEPTGEESDSLSSTSSSLTLSQTGLYTRHLTSPSPLSPETPCFHGNKGWPIDSSKVQLSSVNEARGGAFGERGWRSGRGWAEPEAPAGEETGEGEREAVERGTQWNKSGWDSQLLPVSGVSPAAAHHGQDIYHNDLAFSGVFTATRVELAPDLSPASPLTPDPSSPYQQDMENMMDTLKSMDRPMRSRSLRGVPPSVFSSLAPIVEDASGHNLTPGPATSLAHSPPAPGAPDKAHNGNPPSSIPVDLGIKWSSPKDSLSPFEMMKLQQKQEPFGDKSQSFIPSRRTSLGSDSSHDGSPSYLNGGSGGGNNPLPPGSTSRMDNSFLFSSYRQGSMEQPSVENDRTKAYLSRTASLPDIGPSNDRLSFSSIGMPNTGTGTVTVTGTDNTVPSRYERLSFLVSSSSLSGAPDANSRISRPPPLQHLSSPTSTGDRTFPPPSHMLSPSASSDMQRSYSMEAITARFNHNQAHNQAQIQSMGSMNGMGAMNGMGGGMGSFGSMGHQRSFNNEGTSGGGGGTPLFNSVHGGSHFTPEPEPEKHQMVPKYRAFPDAYLTKEKEHGKLNPRPGKMFIFEEAGMCGQRLEVRGDVIDATPWQLQETISIRVVRGGWVLYEKPNFKGEKIALDEGDIEITYPFNPPEEVMEDGQQQQSEQNGTRQQNGEKENKEKENGEKENGEKENGEKEGEEGNTVPVRRFIIGSIRRAVRDYSVPEISLFPDENAEGKKVTFRDTSEDARIFGFPIKANSIIINAGLWLVYAEPFFQGIPKVLEVGGYHNPAAWGVEQPYVGSVHPLKIGEPRVEKPSEAKLLIFEKPYFTGKTRTIYSNMKDFMTRVERSQIAFMYSAGSIKVQGGCWVGYEKEGFRGYQYLLEEGEYHDWRVWGGHNAELRSIRALRADLTEPMLVMFEQPEGELEEGQQEEENRFEVTEAIPDVELFGYRPTTHSIEVLSGAWVAYSHVDYSGEQYILEKGFYNNCADWGSQDNRICSIQPILLAAGESNGSRNEVILYAETDFQGECHMYDEAQETLADRLLAKSCRVLGGSWVMYDAKIYKGDLYVLSEGDYPNFGSMGCPSSYVIRSLKPVPQMFSLPSISLFGLECLEGREITIDTDMVNMLEEGYNNHTLSVRVNSGSWVVCEHSNYRGRQFLLETIEIPNWPKFSQLHTIGSMYPVRQRRRFFHIRNKERGHFLSIQGGVEELKSGRVVVTEAVEGMSEVWFYQDGLIKNKLAPSMSLQVMGNVEAGAKVVLWSETRQPVQTWSAQMNGAVVSLTFPGMVLDIKGGKTYDRDFAVIMPESEERPCQQWELEIL